MIETTSSKEKDLEEMLLERTYQIIGWTKIWIKSAKEYKSNKNYKRRNTTTKEFLIN